jgi:hypothetical protein
MALLTDGVIEMTSDTVGRSYRMFGRFCLPKLVKPRLPTTFFCEPRRNRIGFAVVLLSLLCCSVMQGYAAENLECPEIGSGRVPDLIGDATGGGLFATENRIELANEINDATNRLQISDPNISWSDVQNVLIAAYCRVVSRKAGSPPLSDGTACASSSAFWNSKSRPTGWLRERCSLPMFHFLPTFFASLGARLRPQVRQRLN